MMTIRTYVLVAFEKKELVFLYFINLSIPQHKYHLVRIEEKVLSTHSVE